jgi:hypothetical protein
VNLGPYAGYVLPQDIQRAFDVVTAQQLADQLGVSGQVTPDLAREAESAYNTYRAGDSTAVLAFLKHRLRASDDVISRALSRLP